ncbi:Flagellar L-ring protein precursor [Roseimaritima multifibrata]|uniref:Flagellar L-ring protein n=1 Tax=Roseimaritima multifibrata TaxID=1930274 RepID=A0A517MLD6_9BACT|nr:flagellar basal body L-ring protein FlgH [Roseimaritima multifibrata]QDS95577.1 Flagellar L-ring protein precursor [Roseimaritima multifibrata]
MNNIPLTHVRRTGKRILLLVGALLGAAVSGPLAAQESSLFHQPPPMANPGANYPPGMAGQPAGQGQYPMPGPSNYGPQANLSQASWTYVPPPPLQQYAKHDVVTIRVDEIAQMRAQGKASSRKNGIYDIVLEEWVRLTGGQLSPAPQPSGDPEIGGTMQSQYRADSSIQSQESLSFNIAAEIVDILPNGNLVLEANKSIWVNDSVFETSLIGVCRARDIGPDNVLLSRDLLDAEIRKDERGRIREGYERGWFTRLLDRFQPF